MRRPHVVATNRTFNGPAARCSAYRCCWVTAYEGSSPVKGDSFGEVFVKTT
ncbi:hypothetical protein ACFU99_19520 [Streptomyces sp. NPDC057654]|uniref:hypothetical protein n=1 Tax=Streptomyces sp. NPDC057654 TaxID=3346196 RepID=UPI00367A8F1E